MRNIAEGNANTAEETPKTEQMTALREKIINIAQNGNQAVIETILNKIKYEDLILSVKDEVEEIEEEKDSIPKTAYGLKQMRINTIDNRLKVLNATLPGLEEELAEQTHMLNTSAHPDAINYLDYDNQLEEVQSIVNEKITLLEEEVRNRYYQVREAALDKRIESDMNTNAHEDMSFHFRHRQAIGFKKENEFISETPQLASISGFQSLPAQTEETLETPIDFNSAAKELIQMSADNQNLQEILRLSGEAEEWSNIILNSKPE